jgi:hypothetical protein
MANETIRTNKAMNSFIPREKVMLGGKKRDMHNSRKGLLVESAKSPEGANSKVKVKKSVMADSYVWVEYGNYKPADYDQASKVKMCEEGRFVSG